MTPVPILLYHSIGSTTSPAYERWCVDPGLFGEHLDVLDTLGYTPLTVSGFIDARQNDALPAQPCLVTFDDGRADFVEGAMPALESRSVPATMYMVSGQVGGASKWLPMPAEQHGPMLSWSELRGIADAGMEVGAHSETHVELDITRSSRLTTEVAASRDRLSEGLGTAIRSFAYPHGYHSARVISAVREAGYDSAVAVKDRWSHCNDDRYSLARMFVWNSTAAEDLEATLSAPPTHVASDRAGQRALRRGWRYARWIRRHTGNGA